MLKAKEKPSTPEEAVRAAAKEREVLTKKLDPKAIKIPPLKRERMTVWLEGTSVLVTHRWTEKAKEEIRSKQQGRALPKKDPKDPVMEYKQSLYPVEGHDGIFGFPAVALKKAMVGSCRFAEGIAMTQARGILHVHGTKSRLVERVKVLDGGYVDMEQVHDLIPIISGAPKMREDPVRIGKGLNKVADLRYRGEFFPWFAQVHLSWMANILTAEQVMNMLALAGYAVGVCENRPEKQGDSWGTWRICGSELIDSFHAGTYVPMSFEDEDLAAAALEEHVQLALGEGGGNAHP